MKNPNNSQHKIMIVDDALLIATKEAIFWKQRGKECGGSLVGVQNESSSLILYAIPTGTNADQSGAHIATDVAYQNKCLRKICGFLKRVGVVVKYFSDYHSHPMWMPFLSGIDKNSCKEILSDPDHSYLLGMPLILVTFKTGNNPVYVPFWITLNRGRLSIEKTTLEVVQATDARVLKALKGQNYLPFHELMNEKVAKAVSQTRNTFSSTINKLFPNRLESEVSEIKDVFGVIPLLQQTSAGDKCIELKKGQCRLIAVLPPEFPLNPAACFIQTNHSALKEFFTHKHWNSFSRIADVFEEALVETSKKKGTDNESNNVTEC